MHDKGTEKNAEKVLRLVSNGTASTIGDDFFNALVRSTAAAMDVRYAFVSEFAGVRTRVRTLSFWAGQGFADNIEYDLTGTPCEEVLAGEVRYYPENVQAYFPEDHGLAEMQAESYLAIPLINKVGDVLGHLAVLDDKPMAPQRDLLFILKIFGARAGAELERKHAEEALQRSEQRLANILASAMDAIIIIDDQRRIVLFNRAAEKVFRCNAAWAISQPFDRLMPKSFRDLFAQRVQSVSGANATEHPLWAPGGLSALRADGEEFPIEVTISPLETCGQRLYTIILRDVKERVRAEEKLREALQQNVYLQEEINRAPTVDHWVGKSKEMEAIIDYVRMVAPTDSTVLLYGETGTGKELIARAIHQWSARKDKLMLTVNCAALPSELVESELFGHEKGAFTSASAQRKGRFELADGGTIFLDEVGELTPQAQAKLLRVLQEQEFERVGGTKTLKINVRVIAATNRNLEEMVKAGTFRADLFYRLNVFPVRVPPLRDRKSDIPALTNFFVSRLQRKLGKVLEGVDPASLERLMSYAWPGNVRELQNVLERAAIQATGPIVRVDELLMGATSAAASEGHTGTLEDIERRHIQQVLEKCRWTIEGKLGAAAVLGLKPSTLRFRMQKLGISKPSFRSH
ncbi:MAG TPA: sigma 54-interacting transcriptional regulator [Gammaproteobacteria bacterium]|nr:sigma 54-interacting transcriptional regulator [Gammaproteobacteria bacterium]